MNKEVKVLTGLELKLITGEIIKIDCSNYEINYNIIKFYNNNYEQLPIIFNFDNVLYCNELFEEKQCGFSLDNPCPLSCPYFKSCIDRNI